MLSYLFYLPMIFQAAEAIVKVIDGKATEQEWNDAMVELRNVVVNIPQLQGFIAIVDVLFRIVKVIIPNIAVPEIARTLRENGITGDDLIRAQNVIDLFEEIVEEAKEENALIQSSIVDKMTDDQKLDQV